MSKEDKKIPIFNLEKIPDKAYIKVLQDRVSELAVEAGKDNSYIIELEERLKSLLELTETDIFQLKKDTIYNKHSKTIKSQEKKIKEYLKTQKKLIGQIMELKMKLKL